MAQNDWLYPISETAGTYWLDKDRGVRARISLPNFRDLVVPGFLSDNWWFISTNFRQVEPGDRVWIYLSGGPGVIGVATVEGLEQRKGRWWLHLNIHKSASRRLCAKPYPGAKVNKYIPYPRGTVTAVDPHAALIRALERAAGL